MNQTELLQWLAKYGWLGRIRENIPAWVQTIAGPILDRMIVPWLRAFQKFNHLPETGELDGSTVALMNAPRCGCPDIMNVSDPEAMPAKWQKKSLTYSLKNYTTLMPTSVQDGVFAEAFGTNGSWAEKLDLTFTRVPAAQTADINITWKRIDGPGNILAQAYLATGRDNPLTMEIDTGEQRWGMLPGSIEPNLEGVIEHELGHNLGLSHNQSNRALMYAMANSNIVDPTELDIEACVALGYQRRTAPVPVPPTIPEIGETIVTLVVKGKTARIVSVA